MAPLPKISVVIITYNFAAYVGECIDSVLSQTLRPFEIVVCDDHSTDESWDIISRYSRRYPDLIKAYQHKKNMGVFYNGTFGAKQYTGDLVSMMDGDDRWLPEKLECEWKALQSTPGAQIAYSNVITIDAQGRRTGVWHDGERAAPPSGDVFAEVFSRRVFSNSRSVFRNELVSRRAFSEEGHCDERLESYWDWDRKIRFAARFPVAYSGKALVEYRQHEESFSRQDAAKHLRAMVDVYEKHLPLLSRRSAEEVIRIRCNIECLLGLELIRLPLSESADFFSVRSVLERNASALRQLPKDDRAVLNAELSPLLAKLCLRAARERLGKGHKISALRYLMHSLQYASKPPDLRLALEIILPSPAFALVQTMHRRIFD